MLRRGLRRLFIFLSKAAWAQRMVTGWGFAWRFASRFIAGQTLEQAIAVVRDLNARGIAVSLDPLGEHTTRPEEALAAVNEALRALEAISASGARANLSLKLTQLGLVLDESLCRVNLRTILQCADQLGIFIRIDMEDSTFTERTVRMYEWARAQGFDNVGIVIQSYLYRSEKDILRIAGNDGRVRLCKGAYDEPPAAAFPGKADVDASYDKLAALLIESARKAGAPQVSTDGRTPPIPAFATHDEARVRFAQAEAERLGLPRGAIEFQMLHGIRRDLQERLAREGYPVRVYVPYGTHWYPYFMRRLAERPANVWFFLTNFFRK
jgi:proline dehydrogenase